ncbi:MAG: hypothetical protein HKN48_02785 [Flavobacteriaceae bacterium]|nr:hypothetical protein [Flavobacteriaceae bacterium]
MKSKLLTSVYAISLIAFIALGNLQAQVGINTLTPQAGSILDVESSDKGLLVPRVNISNLSTIAPITGGATESLLVYNTNTTTGKGFHYWNGSIWIPIESDDWKASGNFGTSPATNFIGTTDNVDMSFRTNNLERLRVTNDGRLSVFQQGNATNPALQWNGDNDTGLFQSAADEISFTTAGTNRLTIMSNGRIRAFNGGSAANPLFSWTGDTDKGFYSPGADLFGLVTNGTERFRIPNANQVHAMNGGTNSLPFYSWDGDTDTGMWKSDIDRLNLTAGGVEFIELFEGGTDELRINDAGADINTRIETSGNTTSLFVDGANDNVGLGTGAPNNSAQLEMADNNRGILINRVALTSATNASPVTSPATGLLVYNTASSSSGSTEVLPGFYYWDGTRWVAMGGTGGKDWGLQGNAGTTLSSNFIGTTDNTTVAFRSNNNERMRIVNDGRVAVNTTAPFAGDRFTVVGASDEYAINAYASGTGTGVYANNSGSGNGVTGITNGGFGTWGQTAASSAVIGGAVALGTATNNSNGMWSLAGVRPTSGAAQNIGVRGVSGSYTSVSPVGYRTVGINANAIDLGMYALTEGPVTTYGDLQAGLFKLNYTGSNIDPDSRDPQASLAGYTTNSLAGAGTMYYGGYFYSGSGTPAYAYAGANFNGTTYKIIGNGTVSTIVDGANTGDSKKVMFAPEAPEVLFEDYGTGRLTNGTASIRIDPIFANNIVVNESHPLKVFIQLEGDCNGVYVTNKTSTGFVVKELQGGSSNVDFSWHIVANRKDGDSNRGMAGSKYEDLRFPDAPGELKQIESKSNTIEPKDHNKLDTPVVSSSQN